MEDRESPVLYLEMTEATPEEYAESACPTCSHCRGSSVRRGGATCTATGPTCRASCPSSTPSACTSATPSFVAPATPDGITGHHFLRTPRPGQGRLTGKPTVSLSLVLISPTTPAEAQALRDWGDFVHLNHIVEAGIPGFTMITPYENATGGDPRYMHFYEFDDPEAEITFKRMRPLVEARIGAWETPECQEWAMHPALRIMYVNSFSLVGES